MVLQQIKNRCSQRQRGSDLVCAYVDSTHIGIEACAKIMMPTVVPMPDCTQTVVPILDCAPTVVPILDCAQTVVPMPDCTDSVHNETDACVQIISGVSWLYDVIMSHSAAHSIHF